MREQNSSRHDSCDKALYCHGLAQDEIDADPIELFQKQRLAREPARIGRLSLPAAAVAFQMLTRRAGAERRFASLLRHLTEHALQRIGELTLDNWRQGVRSTDQGFERVARQDTPGFFGQNQPDTAPVQLKAPQAT